MKSSVIGNYSQNLYAKTEWARYYAEYAQAVEVMLEKPDATHQPLLGLPLLHSMRHVLQMAFKTHVLLIKNQLGHKYAQEQPAVFEETLQDLHHEYTRQFLLLISLKPIKAADCDICIQNNQCLSSFSFMYEWLDNNARGFLYPVQPDGQTKSFQKSETIDFSNLVPVYTITLAALKDTAALLMNRPNRAALS